MRAKKTYILGISAFYHDSAAALVCDGEIIAAAQEERFTRKKHDSSFPENAVNYCLEEAGISAGEVGLIAFYDKPFLKFERLLETYAAYAPVGIKSFIASMPQWIKHKLFIKTYIEETFAYKGKIIFPRHHHSHAASAFYPSPFDEAAVLTVDGVGEWDTASFGIGKKNRIELFEEILFPHSLGLLYSAFTYYCGFKVNSGEYKLMGLAPYGRPEYADIIRDNLVDIKDDGSFRLNLEYFDYCAGLTMTNERFNGLFGGPPRKSEAPITQKHMDIAKSIQDVTEEIILSMAEYVYKKSKLNNLCFAGGVALNCVANGRLLREGPFENIWIQPASGDAGGALGAAFIAWHEYLGKERLSDGITDKQKASLLGPAFTDREIEDFLKSRDIPHEKAEKENIAEITANLLAEGNVIGWFQGRMEFGPRALGSRSILADPRSEKMQSILNEKIKFRESFRPFAPSILLEKTEEYFDLEKESPYMMIVAPVKEEKRRHIEGENGLTGLEKLKVKRSSIPAVTHVDYSARVQTVKREDNEGYYGLLKKFYDNYNCPLVINTSFNVRGEPIVCTPRDAYNCFIKTNMDYLMMGSFILDKKRQNPERPDASDGFESDIKVKDLRRFGMVLGVILTVFGWLHVLKGHANVYPWFFGIGTVILVLGAFFPRSLRSIFTVFVKITSVIGRVITRIMLAFVYYAVLTPIGLIMRIFRKDLLNKKSSGTESYWIKRDMTMESKESLEKQF